MTLQHDSAVILKKLRKTLNMNQHDFAVLVGKPQSTIARIEAESMNPSLGLITEIVNKTGKQVKLVIVKKK